MRKVMRLLYVACAASALATGPGSALAAPSASTAAMRPACWNCTEIDGILYCVKVPCP